VNTFGKLILLKNFSFEKVKYYSFEFLEKGEPEFIDFLHRMEKESEYQEDMDNLMVWLEEIGKYYGAKQKFFRPEGYISDTTALPPPGRIMVSHNIPVRNIRLYCMRLSEHIVILFNGGIKTTEKAQDCRNVSGYFKQANRLVKKIDQLIREHEIQLNQNQTELSFQDNLIIEI